jgi:F0F1-type ATP synthase assembly protein I
MCRQSGLDLLKIIQEFKDKAEDESVNDSPIGPYQAYRLSNALTSFETVLGAEFGALADIYLVAKKKGL